MANTRVLGEALIKFRTNTRSTLKHIKGMVANIQAIDPRKTIENALVPDAKAAGKAVEALDGYKQIPEILKNAGSAFDKIVPKIKGLRRAMSSAAGPAAAFATPIKQIGTATQKILMEQSRSQSNVLKKDISANKVWTKGVSGIENSTTKLRDQSQKTVKSSEKVFRSFEDAAKGIIRFARAAKVTLPTLMALGTHTNTAAKGARSMASAFSKMASNVTKAMNSVDDSAAGTTKRSIQAMQRMQRQVTSTVGKAADGLGQLSKNLDTNVGKRIAEVRKRFSVFNTSMGRVYSTTTRLRTAFRGFAVEATIVAGIMAGMATPIVKSGVAFDQAMASVRAVVNELQDGSQRAVNLFEEISAKAQKLGATTRFTATQVGEAMEFLGLAGLEAREILSGIDGALQLAAAGMMNVAEAADIAVAAMRAFGLAAEDMGRVSDVLAAAATNSNTTIKMLGQSMKFLAPVAAGLGQSLEDAVTAIGVLANAGIRASMAGRGLAVVLGNLAKGGEKFHRILRLYGLAFEEVNPEIVSLRDIIARFDEVGLKAGDAIELFGARAGRAILSLTNQGIRSFDELREKIEGAAGAAERMAAIRMDTLFGAWLIFRSAVEGLSIEVFEAIRENLIGIVTSATKLVQTLIKWVENNKELVSALAMTYGKVTVLVGGFALFMSTLSAGTGIISWWTGGLQKIGETMSWVYEATLKRNFATLVANTAGPAQTAVHGLTASLIGMGVSQEAAGTIAAKMSKSQDLAAGTLLALNEVTQKYAQASLQAFSGTTTFRQSILHLKDQIFKLIAHFANISVEITAFNTLTAKATQLAEGYALSLGAVAANADYAAAALGRYNVATTATIGGKARTAEAPVMAMPMPGGGKGAGKIDDVAEELSESFIKTGKSAKSAAKGMASMSDEAVVAATSGGFLARTLGSLKGMLSSIGALLNPWVAVVAAILAYLGTVVAAAVTGIEKWLGEWEGFVEAVKSSWAAFVAGFASLMGPLQAAWERLENAVAGVLRTTFSGLSDFLYSLEAAFWALGAAVASVSTSLVNYLTLLVKIIQYGNPLLSFLRGVSKIKGFFFGDSNTVSNMRKFARSMEEIDASVKDFQVNVSRHVKTVGLLEKSYKLTKNELRDLIDLLEEGLGSEEALSDLEKSIQASINSLENRMKTEEDLSAGQKAQIQSRIDMLQNEIDEIERASERLDLFSEATGTASERYELVMQKTDALLKKEKELVKIREKLDKVSDTGKGGTAEKELLEDVKETEDEIQKLRDQIKFLEGIPVNFDIQEGSAEEFKEMLRELLGIEKFREKLEGVQEEGEKFADTLDKIAVKNAKAFASDEDSKLFDIGREELDDIELLMERANEIRDILSGTEDEEGNMLLQGFNQRIANVRAVVEEQQKIVAQARKKMNEATEEDRKKSLKRELDRVQAELDASKNKLETLVADRQSYREELEKVENTITGVERRAQKERAEVREEFRKKEREAEFEHAQYLRGIREDFLRETGETERAIRLQYRRELLAAEKRFNEEEFDSELAKQKALADLRATFREREEKALDDFREREAQKEKQNERDLEDLRIQFLEATGRKEEAIRREFQQKRESQLEKWRNDELIDEEEFTRRKAMLTEILAKQELEALANLKKERDKAEPRSKAREISMTIEQKIAEALIAQARSLRQMKMAYEAIIQMELRRERIARAQAKRVADRQRWLDRARDARKEQMMAGEDTDRIDRSIKEMEARLSFEKSVLQKWMDFSFLAKPAPDADFDAFKDRIENMLASLQAASEKLKNSLLSGLLEFSNNAEKSLEKVLSMVRGFSIVLEDVGESWAAALLRGWNRGAGELIAAISNVMAAIHTLMRPETRHSPSLIDIWDMNVQVVKHGIERMGGFIQDSAARLRMPTLEMGMPQIDSVSKGASSVSNMTTSRQDNRTVNMNVNNYVDVDNVRRQIGESLRDNGFQNISLL